MRGFFALEQIVCSCVSSPRPTTSRCPYAFPPHRYYVCTSQGSHFLHSSHLAWGGSSWGPKDSTPNYGPARSHEHFPCNDFPTVRMAQGINRNQAMWVRGDNLLNIVVPFKGFVCPKHERGLQLGCAKTLKF